MKTQKYTHYRRADIMAYESPQDTIRDDKNELDSRGSLPVDTYSPQTKPESVRNDATNAMDGREQPFIRDKTADSSRGFEQIEIPDNSELARQLREQHPRIMKFEEKYQNVNWRGRLV